MLGRLLLVAALMLAVAGALLLLGEKYPGLRLGRLPGDIVIQRNNSTLFIPVTSLLLVSLFLSIAFSLLRIVKR